MSLSKLWDSFQRYISNFIKKNPSADGLGVPELIHSLLGFLLIVSKWLMFVTWNLLNFHNGLYDTFSQSFIPISRVLQKFSETTKKLSQETFMNFRKLKYAYFLNHNFSENKFKNIPLSCDAFIYDFIKTFSILVSTSGRNYILYFIVFSCVHDNNGGTRRTVSEGPKNQQKSNKDIKQNQVNYQKKQKTNHEKQQQQQQKTTNPRLTFQPRISFQINHHLPQQHPSLQQLRQNSQKHQNR